jgi:hypothetical protein
MIENVNKKWSNSQVACECTGAFIADATALCTGLSGVDEWLVSLSSAVVCRPFVFAPVYPVAEPGVRASVTHTFTLLTTGTGTWTSHLMGPASLYLPLHSSQNVKSMYHLPTCHKKHHSAKYQFLFNCGVVCV